MKRNSEDPLDTLLSGKVLPGLMIPLGTYIIDLCISKTKMHEKQHKRDKVYCVIQ